MILIHIPKQKGDCKIKGFDGSVESKEWFTVESFSFGVQRELADSAKSGTEDVTIGVGELQECTFSKSMDITSNFLAQRAINGASVGEMEIKFVEAITLDDGEAYNAVYLHFKLHNAFIKSWSMSGDADGRPTEDVSVWYNKIAFVYFPSPDRKTFGGGMVCEWDHVHSKVWKEHKLNVGKAEIIKAS